MASDVAVVVISLFGMWMTRSGRWGILVLAALRHCQLPDHGSEAKLRVSGQPEISGVVRRFFRGKARCFGANGANACGCRNPLGGVVVVTFSTLGFWVKTLDRR
jgi:hypothetical protein